MAEGGSFELHADRAWLTLGTADAPALLGRLREQAREAGAVAVSWPVDAPDAGTDEAAEEAGLRARRDLYQLRRPLPLEPSRRAAPPVPGLRPFRPGTDDEAAWVTVNNRAFAHHPDQGRETVAGLRTLMAEPWFDAEGFLLLDGTPPVDSGGGLDGFCWTKVHRATTTDPAMGEIYVIGVDPNAHGRGLGTALVVAGLEHLDGRGLSTAMLYVDADNAPALGLYDRLAFTRHHIHRVYGDGDAAEDGAA